MFTSDKEKIAFKRQLKVVALSFLESRIARLIDAIKQSLDSVNKESKSPMGDKYETSRAMGQLDAEMNSKQLNEVSKELNELKQLDIDTVLTKVIPGSVVCLDEITFFIASGLGTIKVENREVITLSPKSPLYQLLKFKITGERVIFQNQERIITTIF